MKDLICLQKYTLEFLTEVDSVSPPIFAGIEAMTDSVLAIYGLSAPSACVESSAPKIEPKTQRRTIISSPKKRNDATIHYGFIGACVLNRHLMHIHNKAIVLEFQNRE